MITTTPCRPLRLRYVTPPAPEHVLARGRQVPRVQYLFRFLRAQDPLLDHELLDRLPGLPRLLRDLRGLFVADDRVQPRRDRGARFRVPLQDVDVRADAVDALVREHARHVREELDVLL